MFIYNYFVKNPLKPQNIQNNITNNTDTFKLLIDNKIKQEYFEDIIPKKEDSIKMMIFIATWCGACNAYKNNVHNDLAKKLQEQYNNIQFEFVVDDPENENIAKLQKYYEIKYFPTIILYKNDKYKKLPMNTATTKESIVKLVDSI